MAKYSYGSSTSTTNNYVTSTSSSYSYTPFGEKKRSSAIVECKRCNHTTVVDRNKVKVVICPKCKRTNDLKGREVEGKFFNEHGDNSVKPSTHIQISWQCRFCAARGVRWINKKDNKFDLKCKECQQGNMIIRSVPAGGRRKDIWGGGPEHKPAVPRAVMMCRECGRAHKYFFRKPDRCNNCGWEFDQDD